MWTNKYLKNYSLARCLLAAFATSMWYRYMAFSIYRHLTPPPDVYIQKTLNRRKTPENGI